jgi:predicted small secreted protein
MKFKLLLVALSLALVTLGLTACQTHSDHAGHSDGAGPSGHSGCH